MLNRCPYYKIRENKPMKYEKYYKGRNDLFSGIVFGTLFGLSVSLIAIPQFAILALLYASAAFLAPYMTPGMLSDFTACGGVIFVATGLRMCGIKIFPVINMLPSMLIIMPLSALWARYVG